MRGTPIYQNTIFTRDGLIPTYAGNTWCGLRLLWCSWAHPHVCGEHTAPMLMMPCVKGSSPRMRGTPLDQSNGKKYLVAHPHVCGEHCQMLRT